MIPNLALCKDRKTEVVLSQAILLDHNLKKLKKKKEINVSSSCEFTEKSFRQNYHLYLGPI